MGVNSLSRWRIVLTDIAGSSGSGGGVVLNASSRQYTHGLNVGKIFQFVINIDNPRADFLLTRDCLVKVYRKTKVSAAWQLLFVGDVISSEETGSGDLGLITVIAADPYWRLQRRVVGMAVDSIGRGTGYTDGTALAQVDNSTLVADLLNSINSVFYTGVTLGTVTACGTVGYIGPVYAQNVGDLIQQICNTLGGPNFELVPHEPSGAMPNTQIATMNVVPALGSTKVNTVFEYGVGKRNMATYSRLLSKDGLCNQVFSPPQGFPSVSAHSDTMIIGIDLTSIAAIGLYQDVIQGDLTSGVLRQVLANEYVTVRKQARQQITFTITVDCPYDYNVDYIVGDVVPVRARANNTYRFNGTARIYGASITIDDNDSETTGLTLIPS